MHPRSDSTATAAPLHGVPAGGMPSESAKDADLAKECVAGLTIVRATTDHVDELAGLFDCYRQFYKEPSNITRGKNFLLDRMMRGESVLFLARYHETPVGFVQLYPSFSSVSCQRLWILNDVFVDDSVRRKGVGRALLNVAREFALGTSAKALVLETAQDNLPAQKLYEQLGYVRDQEMYRYTLVINN